MSNRENDYETLGVSVDAQRAANEFVDRISGELLLRSRIYAEARGSHTVERPDVYRASKDFELPSGLPSDNRRRRAVIYGGVVGFAFSTLVGLFLVKGGLREADQLASAMGALVGALGAALSVVALREAKRSSRAASITGNPPAASDDTGELIAVWRDIERMLLDDMPEGPRKGRYGVGVLMPEFALRHNLGSEFVEQVRSLLQVRNRIVHDAGTPVTREEVSSSLREARRVASLVQEVTQSRGGDQRGGGQ